MNAHLVGKRYPGQSFALEAQRVTLFSEAIGHPADGVPPTFATAAEQAAMASVVGDPDLGLDFSRVVHGEQQYEWERELIVGETLTAVPTIESIRRKGGLELLTVRTELLDGSGRAVVVARSTLIARGEA